MSVKYLVSAVYVFVAAAFLTSGDARAEPWCGNKVLPVCWDYAPDTASVLAHCNTGGCEYNGIQFAGSGAGCAYRYSCVNRPEED